MVGAVLLYFRYERPPKSHRDLPHSGPETPPLLPLHPLVTIVVPCHNEGRDIEDTVAYLLASIYPNFDILLVNDGSDDETRQILDGSPSNTLKYGDPLRAQPGQGSRAHHSVADDLQRSTCAASTPTRCWIRSAVMVDGALPESACRRRHR